MSLRSRLFGSALLILLACIVAGAVWASRERIGRTPVTSAATIAVSPAFAHYYRHHVGIADACKNPLGRATFLHGVAEQHFEHCTLIAIYSVAPFPIPTTAPLPSPLPTTAPTARPAPTSTSAPAPTAIPSNDPVLYLLGLLNGERQSHGIAPLALNATQSACSLAHSVHMAAEGYISHDQWPSDLCVPWSAAGENVGMAAAAERTAILLDFNQMMSEYTGSCSGVTSHACNILSPSYHQIGIGIDYVSGTLWLTEDFVS